MELKSLITNDKIIEIEHPGFEGLIITLAYISRERVKKLIEKATTSSFSRKTHQLEEKVDQDLFLNMYIPEVIKGWKGFKYEYLEELVPVDLSSVSPDAELDYSKNNAIELMKNSNDFDNWITSVVNDIKNFNKSS